MPLDSPLGIPLGLAVTDNKPPAHFQPAKNCWWATAGFAYHHCCQGRCGTSLLIYFFLINASLIPGQSEAYIAVHTVSAGFNLALVGEVYGLPATFYQSGYLCPLADAGQSHWLTVKT